MKQIDNFIQEHGNYLYSFAKSRISNDSDLEDVLQETFLAACRSVETFRDESSVRTWLTGILRHKIMDYYRVKSRDSRISEMEIQEQEDYPFRPNGYWQMDRRPVYWNDSAMDDIEKKEVAQRLQRCIKNLPTSLARVYTLRELEDAKTPEICDLLSLTEVHVNVLIYRARMHLRSCLEKFGIKSVPAN